ncbi:MAG: HAD hydrolase-like protein [Candidatus Woesearchaeota archaeon]
MKAVILDFNRTLFDPEKKELVNGAKQLLNFFLVTGWKLGLISVNSPERESFIKQISFYFDSIKLVKDKSKETFIELLNEISADPKSTIVIGDRIKEEISFGNQLGMQTFWIKTGKFSKELAENKSEIPNFIFRDLNELRSFLNNNELMGDIK